MWDTRGCAGRIGVSKVRRGREACEACASSTKEVAEMVLYRGNGDEKVGKGDGGGAEGAYQFPTGVILGSLEDREEGGLSDVGEPCLRGISEDGDADGVEDFAPGN